jgi:hypothetical protein
MRGRNPAVINLDQKRFSTTDRLDGLGIERVHKYISGLPRSFSHPASKYQDVIISSN